LGHEYNGSHRSYRHLAEKLASAGLAAMRFDYHGTGDSGGNENDPELVRTWLDDIERAVDEFQRRSGVRKIALVGARAGALLAAVAAVKRGGVDRLVLWSPFLAGGAYLRELRRMEKIYAMLHRRAGNVARGGEDMKAAGLFLPCTAMTELERIDLRAIATAPASSVLILSRAGESAELPLLQRLKALDVTVLHRDFPGEACWTNNPHTPPLPERSHHAIVSFLREGSCADSQALSVGNGTKALDPVPASLPSEIADVGGTSPWHETFFHFGPGRRLFGVFTKPTAQGAAQRSVPGILILNAGFVHRVGPRCIFARQARRWAALGFPVLRFDLAGLGDSRSEGGEEDQLLPPSAESDVRAAMDALGACARRFVLVGLCSGAQHALQVAVKDPRVSGVVLVNLPADAWMSPAHLFKFKARFYRRLLFRLDTWRRVLLGRVNVRYVAAVLATAALGHIRARLASGRGGGISPLDKLCNSDLHTLMVFSDEEVSIEVGSSPWDFELGNGGQIGGITVARVNADHLFSGKRAESALNDVISEHLVRSHLGPLKPPPSIGAPASLRPIHPVAEQAP
jgi:alpha-beta hydrolase superfamily lysophospholipase